MLVVSPPDLKEKFQVPDLPSFANVAVDAPYVTLNNDQDMLVTVRSFQ
jgi:hypothetical protein